MGQSEKHLSDNYRERRGNPLYISQKEQEHAGRIVGQVWPSFFVQNDSLNTISEGYVSQDGFDNLKRLEKGRTLGFKILHYITREYFKTDIDTVNIYAKDMEYILTAFEKKFGNLNQLQSFVIENGLLTLSYTVPPRLQESKYIINLSELILPSTQNRSKSHMHQNILDEARKKPVQDSLDKMRTDIDIESYFGGAVIVHYDKLQSAKNMGSHIGGTVLLGGSVMGGARMTQYNIEKIFFKGEDGKLIAIAKDQIKKIINFSGSKSKLAENLFRIIGSTGQVFNVIRGTFTTPVRLAFDRTIQGFSKITPRDVGTIEGKDFERVKSSIIETAKATPTAGIGSYLKKLPALGLSALLLGVFFREYQKNSTDVVSLYKGVAEMGLFTGGATIGSKLAPGFWKMPAALIGGGLGIVAGGIAGGAMNLDKKALKYRPEREATTEKSFIGHVITMGTMNDAMDRVDTDFRLGGLQGGARVWNPVGKDVIFPDISFNRTSVDFGTNPQHYLSAGVRDISLWNTRIDEFVQWASPEIMKVMNDYKNNRGMFSASNIIEYGLQSAEENKKQALRDRIAPIIGGSETRYEMMKNSDGKKSYVLISENTKNQMVIDDILSFVSSGFDKISNSTEQQIRLDMILKNYANILKIDDMYIANEKKLLEKDKIEIDMLLLKYSEKFSPEQKAFVQVIKNRMNNAEKLIQGKMIRVPGAARGGSVLKWKPDFKEESLYRGFIDDSTIAGEEWYTLLGINPNKPDKVLDNNIGISPDVTNPFDTSFYEIEENTTKPTLGDVFIKLLNLMAENKKQKFFIDEIEKTGHGIKWKS